MRSKQFSSQGVIPPNSGQTTHWRCPRDTHPAKRPAGLAYHKGQSGLIPAPAAHSRRNNHRGSQGFLHLRKLWHPVGDDIVVQQGGDGQIKAHHRTNLAGMVSRCIDHMLGQNRALLRPHFPLAEKRWLRPVTRQFLRALAQAAVRPSPWPGRCPKGPHGHHRGYRARQDTCGFDIIERIQARDLCGINDLCLLPTRQHTASRICCIQSI